MSFQDAMNKCIMPAFIFWVKKWKEPNQTIDWRDFLFFPPEQEVLTATHIYSSEMIALGENDAKILKTD